MAKKRKNPPKSDSSPTAAAAAAATSTAAASTEPDQVQPQQQQPQPDPEIKPAEPEIKTQEEDDPTIKEEGLQFDDDEEFEETETDEISQEKDESAPNGEAKPEELIKKEDDCNDGDDDNEPIQKLLEPFTKDQLIEILTQAAESHTDVLDQIRKLSDTDPVHRKIFVHGLGWDTTSESLTEVFKQYGEIEDCNCVTDKITGKSKGYAFILYKSRSGARKALKEPQKKIGNRMTACQLASAGPVPAQVHHAPAAVVVPATPASEYTQRKIYVSNVGPEVDPQKLVPFFSKFGEIEEGPLGLDKHTGKPKGFALFVYKSVESAKKALEEPHKNFEGTILHCQKAIDGPKPNKQNYTAGGSSGGARPSKFQRTDNSGYGAGHLSSGVGAAGHLMAQSGHGMGYNQTAAPAINPIVGQALTALLASQGGGGLGLTNLLGTLGAGGVTPNMNPAGPPMAGGYGSQYGSGYGSQTSAQGGYYSQAGQGSGGRSQKGGYMGGSNPYLGHGH